MELEILPGADHYQAHRIMDAFGLYRRAQIHEAEDVFINDAGLRVTPRRIQHLAPSSVALRFSSDHEISHQFSWVSPKQMHGIIA